MVTQEKRRVEGRLPDKPSDQLWSVYLEGFKMLLVAIYRCYGMSAICEFAGCSAPVITQKLKDWKVYVDGNRGALPEPPLSEDDKHYPPHEHIAIVAESGDKKRDSQDNMSASYWRGRHDGYREATLALHGILKTV